MFIGKWVCSISTEPKDKNSLRLNSFNFYNQKRPEFNPLNAELNPVCHLLTLLGAHPIFHISRIRVNFLSL
jgi:hypothetical protein